MSLTAFAIPTVPEYEVEAVYIGPTWRRDEQGDFVLPERTLGWQILTWIGQYLNGPAGGPFKPTKEQTRFLLWWYAVDDEGRFVYRDGILQRLKGWGKDPLVAVICLVEMLGPCRFDYFTDEDMDDLGLMAGDPVGKENPAAWVQVAAVSEKQTKNTMLLFGSLISKKLMAEHGMTKLDIGKQTIYAYRGSRQIEAVTSSPRALEGGRPTFVVRNETHHWIEANGGHEMADVIERNATKSAGGQARALSITNAYDPSEGSVAQVQREAWEAEQTGEYVDTNVLYDSIEAPEGISMRPPEAAVEWKLPPATPEEREYREACVRAWLAAVLTAVRGDAVWLDIPSITNAILSQRNGAAASTARRFWFNNIVAAEDRWADPPAIEAGIHPLLRHARATEGDADQLRLGWIVDPDDPIVMFFDGSKNDDSTVLVGTRIDDGYTFVIGVWSKPRGDAGKGWEVPREEVNARVVEAFERFTIVAFWADPSHTLEDDNTRFWDRYIDRWHQAHKDQLQNWPVLTGNRVSSIMWDMTDRVRTSQFVAACEIVRSDIHARDMLGDYAPTFLHDGHPALRAHLRNAHENPGPDGISVRKKNRSSNNKIDLAVALIGAQMLRRVCMNAGIEEQKSSGGGWVTAL